MAYAEQDLTEIVYVVSISCLNDMNCLVFHSHILFVENYHYMWQSNCTTACPGYFL
jgi:hypothetical protein